MPLPRPRVWQISSTSIRMSMMKRTYGHPKIASRIFHFTRILRVCHGLGMGRVVNQCHMALKIAPVLITRSATGCKPQYPNTDATHSPISNITYDFRYPSGIVDNLSVEIQDKHTSVSAASEKNPVPEASSATMGSILFNGKFKCTEVACANKTFGRRAELQRHHATIHAVEKWFWCPIPSCSRSKEPFARKDKLADHVRNIHEV